MPIASRLSSPAVLLATVAVYVACLTLLAAGQARAAIAEERPLGAGTLLLQAPGGASLEAMRLGTDIAVKVNGPTARVTVTQAFRNTGSDWVEATYLYPLPEESAVDSLKMVVGERVIIGTIEPRREARKIYEQARRDGRKAGLVEQFRGNAFRTNVANVGPGETVLVNIEYQMPVTRRAADYLIRLPLVAAPRYTPPARIAGPAGLGAKALQDAQALTAPVLRPEQSKGINPVTISVDLKPGFQPSGIESAYHPIRVKKGKGNERLVTLANTSIPANRDFELRWRSAEKAPSLALFRETVDAEDYMLATVTPPIRLDTIAIPPRDMIFVIDNSGSMGGESIRQAKAALLETLGTLRPQDHFNIIRFDDTMTDLFGSPVPASPDNLSRAREYVGGLDARGGTEMLPALRAALVDRRNAQDARMHLRQVVFLTDGAISNETRMMEEVSRNVGRSRIFMVGIGSAPNGYLMARMAALGRGRFLYISAPGEVMSGVADLARSLQTPVLRDVEVEIEGANLALARQRIPDLYAGGMLTILARGSAENGRLTIHAMLGDTPWSASLPLEKAIAGEGIGKLWARRRIGDIKADQVMGLLSADAAKTEITQLGLTFSLVTDHTSLVAVDHTPSRPNTDTLRREDLPILLPAGWDFDKLFGSARRKAALHPPANREMAADQAEALRLPNTALNIAPYSPFSLLAVLLGVAGLWVTRRRRDAGR
jgi:Ca-activated chloride channel family protein